MSYKFLDFKLNTPFGLASCAASLTPTILKFIENDCSIITYKTIRSVPYKGNPAPNITNVMQRQQLTEKDFHKIIYTSQEQTPVETLSWANSHGIACPELSVVAQEYATVKKALKPGQIFISSIYGESSGTKSLEQDFIDLALFAAQNGSDAIEANFSCPNMKNTKTLLFESPEQVKTICTAITKAVPHIPLIVKIGYVPDNHQLEQLLVALQVGGARAVCSMNSFGMQIIDKKNNQPFFGLSRRISGVSGHILFNLALDQATRIATIISNKKLNLELVGTGGIMQASDAITYLNNGATVITSATGLMNKTQLGTEIKKSLQTAYTVHHPAIQKEQQYV